MRCGGRQSADGQFFAAWRNAGCAGKDPAGKHKNAFAKAPDPGTKDEAVKAWKSDFNDVRNEIKGSSGILAKAMERLKPLNDPDQDGSTA